nr:MAG TPA: hypothetical protein [Caudoviricetes sp.]
MTSGFASSNTLPKLRHNKSPRRYLSAGDFLFAAGCSRHECRDHLLVAAFSERK